MDYAIRSLEIGEDDLSVADLYAILIDQHIHIIARQGFHFLAIEIDDLRSHHLAVDYMEKQDFSQGLCVSEQTFYGAIGQGSKGLVSWCKDGEGSFCL